MKTLYILRHGTPEKHGPDGTDHSRPLARQGILESETQGRVLAGAGAALDLIATSTARRAVETAETLRDALPADPPLKASEALYGASGGQLLSWLQGLPEDVGTLLLVGHMPGLAELLSLLVTGHDDLFVKVSPGTLSGLTLGETATWAETAPGEGMLFMLAPPVPTAI